MSLYVLDTDILSLYREYDPVVSRRVNACPPHEIAITVITVEEQLSGLAIEDWSV
jgi:tRNA(fMet)-specific endonuclease VapC